MTLKPKMKMKPKLKSWSVLTALTLVVALLLSACGQSGGSAGGDSNGTGGTGAAGGGGAGGDGAGAAVSIGQQVKHQIIGIDPGAGIMKATATAIQEYGLADWKLIEGSGAAMTAMLNEAIKKQEPIIITGWTPHWMFAKYDLKYLDDPKKVYGEAEEIHTIARLGLKDDHPEAYQFLSKFKWTSDQMGEIMTAIQEGKDPEAAAKAWMDANAEVVAKWTEGIQPVSGKTFKFSYVAWDSEIASTHLLKVIMQEKLGYKVEALQVEAGPMWTGVANGDVDASVAAWLPLTHADYLAKFKDKIDDIGANMEGVKTGLVVPAYVEINSIEDLAKK